MLKNPPPILVGSRQRETIIQSLWIPAKFWDDHSERCPSDNGEAGICTEVRRSGRRVLVEGNFAQVDALLDDAKFYAEGNVDDCAALVRSAKATVAAIEGDTQ